MPLFGPPDLDKLKAKGDVPGLTKVFVTRRDEAVRKAAARVLVQIGAPAVEPLIAALNVNAPYTTIIAEALGQIGEPAVKPLLAALMEPNRHVPKAPALMALGLTGDARRVEPLIA